MKIVQTAIKETQYKKLSEKVPKETHRSAKRLFIPREKRGWPQPQEQKQPWQNTKGWGDLCVFFFFGGGKIGKEGENKVAQGLRSNSRHDQEGKRCLKKIEKGEKGKIQAFFWHTPPKDKPRGTTKKGWSWQRKAADRRQEGLNQFWKVVLKVCWGGGGVWGSNTQGGGGGCRSKKPQDHLELFSKSVWNGSYGSL